MPNVLTDDAIMTKRPPLDAQQIRLAIVDFLQKHWKIFFTEGLLFVVLGTLAVAAPHVSTIGITIFLGWLLLLGGVIQIIRATRFITMPGFSLWFFIGMLQSVVGYFLVTEPLHGSLTLTMLLTVFFAIEGLIKMFIAMMMRPLAHWGSMFFTGITALCLSIVVWMGWPDTGYWVLGLLVGINMILLGWVLIKISLHHKTTT